MMAGMLRKPLWLMLALVTTGSVLAQQLESAVVEADGQTGIALSGSAVGVDGAAAEPGAANAREADGAHAGGYVDLWQLYQDALSADPRILAAEGRAVAGEGQRVAARGRLLPQLSASGSYQRSDRRADNYREIYNGERYALSLNQALFDLAAWRNYERYRALAGQRDAEYEEVLSEAAVDLAQRYFAALAAEDEMALTQAERRAMQRNLDQVESLYERRLARVTDLLQISARVDALVAREIEASNEVAVTREALAELVGYPVHHRLERIGAGAVFAEPQQDEAYWVEAALTTNPALTARQEAVAAAQAAIGEAKGGHYPTVNLFASVQESDIGYENSLMPTTETYVVGVGVQIPIFSGGSTRGRVKAAYGELTATQQEQEALRRQITREARTAYLNVKASVSKVGASEKALQSALRAREAAEKGFSYGVQTAVDVLNAVQEEYRARRDYLQAQYEYALGMLVLNRWAGTLGADEIRSMSDWLEPRPVAPAAEVAARQQDPRG